MENRLYSKEEVERILSRVIKVKGYAGDKFSIEDILSIAKELNLDPKQVLSSIKEEESVHELEKAKILWQKKKKNEFYQHLSAYCLINLTSIVLSIKFAPDLIPFPIMVAIFWGVGLIANFIESFFPTEDKIERGAKKLLRSQKWKDRVASFVDNLLDSLPRKK